MFPGGHTTGLMNTSELDGWALQRANCSGREEQRKDGCSIDWCQERLDFDWRALKDPQLLR